MTLLQSAPAQTAAAAGTAPIPTISAAGLSDTLTGAPQTVVLDVRTPAEFTGPLGHIDGAYLIPVQELENRVAELDTLKDRPIYVICRSGNRSKTATGILLENDFRAVNVAGGMQAWNKLPEHQPRSEPDSQE
ncbi:MAG: rhodanese-like domain-containing protein [Candidatus Neomarinimicrobiota bacterium]